MLELKSVCNIACWLTTFKIKWFSQGSLQRSGLFSTSNQGYIMKFAVICYSENKQLKSLKIIILKHKLALPIWRASCFWGEISVSNICHLKFYTNVDECNPGVWVSPSARTNLIVIFTLWVKLQDTYRGAAFAC